jgi:regulator of sigma E protease
MIFSLLYILLAAFGLGLLIFIHELGHYWMAKKEGMTIEAFSIGFGKPIRTWERNGVKWQICWLPFGGYVRIAGMEAKGGVEPSEIPDGFFGKSPLSRIKVALMGPLVNIAFALLAFSLLWCLGGRQKSFSEYTHLIGWVDPSSEVFDSGVRAGDEITKIGDKPFQGFQDFIYYAIFNDSAPKISGIEKNYFTGAKQPFQYQFALPKKAPISDRVRVALTVMQPASYLIYNQRASLNLDQNSPMKGSGIEDGDRLLWVDGELVFSRQQIVEIINQQKTLLTVQRGTRTFLVRVPRLKLSDLRLNAEQKAEIEDWQHEAHVKGKSSDLFFIPYSLNSSGQIEQVVAYFNDEHVEQQPKPAARAALEMPLQPGDRIIAVDGMGVRSIYELIQLLQTRHIQIIVKKKEQTTPVSWKEADQAFIAGIQWEDLAQMIQSIGTSHPIREQGQLKLLNPAIPKPLNQMSISENKREQMEAEAAAMLKKIEEIKDSKQREIAMQEFESQLNQVKLGIAMTDRKVNYNPSPLKLFNHVLQETWKTIVALFSGTVSPKYMSGPVGIVQVMQQSWSIGFTEALFWLGMISMNLGILNLMPIPVLDGGHICFSLWEWITKKPIKTKTMERLVIPFVILLIGLFVFLTYNDLMRLFSGFFR